MNEGKFTVLGEARRLHALGFSILWLKPKSKMPVENGWTQGPRKTWKELKATYREGMNVGVRLGSPSVVTGKYLAVIDVDVKGSEERHRKEALLAAKPFRSGVKGIPRVDSGRGNGSLHLYCLTDKPFQGGDVAKSAELVRVHMPSVKVPSKRDRKMLSEKEIARGYRMRPAWEVTTMSEGRQVVLPPSVHPDTGKNYIWRRRLETAGALTVLPLETARARSHDAGEERGPSDPQEPAERATKLTGFQVEPVDLGWLPISDAVRSAIIDGTGVENRSDYLLRAATALVSAGLTRNEVLTVLTDKETFLGHAGFEHADTTSRAVAANWIYRYTLAKVTRERDASSLDVFRLPLPAARELTADEVRAKETALEEESDWTDSLDRGPKGGFRTTLKNLDLIITKTVEGNVFVEDLFASRVGYGADPPWEKRGEYIDDKDLIRVKRWFADTRFQMEPSTNQILEATSLLADRCRVHPVRDWLEALKWDGVERTASWLRDYCHAVAPEPYLSEVSQTFLGAMVKRVFEPGCQWDYVPVLQGDQGERKSSAARALTSDRWFMDNIPDLRDKDAMLNLQGKWVVELAELVDVRRADYNLVKSYLTRRVDTVRPHYGRLKSDVPRQSVFIGTVNEGQYLKDPTGNRRYWPIKVTKKCDVAGLTAAREQLFAETMHRYRTNNPVLMLSEKAERQARKLQEARRVHDEFSEMKEAFLSFRDSDAGAVFNFKKFRTADLMVGVDAPWGMWAGGKGYLLNIAATVLHSLGYENKKRGGRYVWIPVSEVAKSASKLGESLGSLESDSPNLDFF